MEEREEKVTRRSFLSWMIGAIGAFVVSVVGIPIVGFVVSPAMAKKEAQWAKTGPTSGFELNKPRLVDFTVVRKDGWIEQPTTKSVWVVAHSEKDFTVYNARCTHLGCLVNWHEDKQAFVSPCHGGVFTIDGKVIAGPPPRPLDTLEWRIEGGTLTVDYRDFRLGISEKVEI